MALDYTSIALTFWLRSLNDNKIGDAGAVALAAVLKENSSIRMLR